MADSPDSKNSAYGNKSGVKIDNPISTHLAQYRRPALDEYMIRGNQIADQNAQDMDPSPLTTSQS